MLLGGNLWPVVLALVIVLVTFCWRMAVSCFCFHPGAVTGDAETRQQPSKHINTSEGRADQGHLSADQLQKFLAIETRLPEDTPIASFQPSTSEPSCVLSFGEIASIAAAVPPRFRVRKWQLSYSTRNHGTSLQTLYRRSEAWPTVLVVRDLQGCCFGCFVTETWRVRPRFFGTGESFVFRLVSDQPAASAAAHQGAEELRPSGRRVEVWRWWSQRMGVERNDYFQYAAPDKLAIGGCGAHALRLGADLMSGSSGKCRTYGSPCLAASEDFEVGKVEAWALVD